ncbi:Protocadherin Fat 4, partial [Lamellibrachia satsuma]
DINDHSPIFQHKSYAAQLSELIPVGSFVAAITATDSDTGNNAQITYTISSGNRHGYFEINSETGLVTTAKSLDREKRRQYKLNITATDLGTPPRSNSIMITINVIDVNDNAPRFSTMSVLRRVAEGVDIGTEVVTINATDLDSG